MEQAIDFTRVPTLTNVLGKDAVWVALAFISNETGNRAEGVYVDGVEVRVCYRECPGGSRIQALERGEQGERLMVTRRAGQASPPARGLQPFLSPLSAPEPFRLPLPAPQP
ncbi:MAG: hypothetical protein RML36_17325 [Anaerolineae bacterium]|nr:hypothetical protein [Anaerolineae bacterium]